MRNIVILGLSAGLMLAGSAAVAQGPPKSPRAKRGEAIVMELAAGRFHQVEAQFDARMAKALPEAKLSEVWAQIQSQAGPFKLITGSRETKLKTYDVALVNCAFAKLSLQAVVAIDGDGRVGGLSFRPVQ